MTPAELRSYLRHVDESMATEGLAEHVRKRVINRVIYGHPEGYRPVLDPAAQQRPLTGLPFPSPETHEVIPARDAPWFGRDGREIDYDPEAAVNAPRLEAYPVTSTCRCGRMIMKERNTAQWEHCD